MPATAPSNTVKVRLFCAWVDKSDAWLSTR